MAPRQQVLSTASQRQPRQLALFTLTSSTSAPVRGSESLAYSPRGLIMRCKTGLYDKHCQEIIRRWLFM